MHIKIEESNILSFKRNLRNKAGCCNILMLRDWARNFKWHYICRMEFPFKTVSLDIWLYKDDRLIHISLQNLFTEYLVIFDKFVCKLFDIQKNIIILTFQKSKKITTFIFTTYHLEHIVFGIFKKYISSPLRWDDTAL